MCDPSRALHLDLDVTVSTQSMALSPAHPWGQVAGLGVESKSVPPFALLLRCTQRQFKIRLYPQPTSMVEAGTAAGGVMDVKTALQEVLKTTLCHDG